MKLTWSLPLIMKAAVFNGLLVTVVSAGEFALLIGAGTVYSPYRGGGAASVIWSLAALVPDPWEVAKTTVLLCPITAVLCGSFGLLAGFAGGTLLCLRRPHIRSTKRFLVEAAILGFLLGALFPFFDHQMQVGIFYPIGGYLSSFCVLASGGPCAVICALTFRKSYMAI